MDLTWSCEPIDLTVDIVVVAIDDASDGFAEELKHAGVEKAVHFEAAVDEADMH